MLPAELFEDMPKSKSKAKVRRLKVVSDAFAKEKVVRLKQLQKDISDHIIEQEMKVDAYRELMKAKKMPPSKKTQEEEKKEGGNISSSGQRVATPPRPGTDASGAKPGDVGKSFVLVEHVTGSTSQGLNTSRGKK